jgi:phosphate transport system permease protein
MAMSSQQRKGGFWREGEPFIWLSGAALAAVLLMATLLVMVVTANGITVFWPARQTVFELRQGPAVMGVVQRESRDPKTGARRVQVKIANRDLYGLDFRWLGDHDISATRQPADAVVLERREYGNVHGFLRTLDLGAGARPASWAEFQAALRQARTDREPMDRVQRDLNTLGGQLENVRLSLAKLRYHGRRDDDPAVVKAQARQAELKAEFARQVAAFDRLAVEIRRRTVGVADAGGRVIVTPLVDVIRANQPNCMGLPAKAWFYAGKLWELFFGEPRESNTEGGLFPAIVGTVMMVFIMSIFSFPLGVVTGVYLREYARDGWLVRLVRIAVNNLAGVPSIVYGIFGLGFFVYGVGGALDQLFFPERLPTPTLGTGGILWASLTLALLTVPVVIVATEEALGAIPKGVRDGSLALGATKLQTLTRVLLPMASPGVMTGFILAMARAAGEVAPLMITGVVKLAPALPLDGQYPFIHLERKFMHLGFHIYDIGFQSPNVEAAKPMVFVTTLLLVLIVLVMSAAAIHLRNTMKRRYTLGSF